MAVSKATANRLRRELKAISEDPPPLLHVSYDEANILAWSYLLEGPPDTPYEGGWYWGRLRFPKEYPLLPPSILMITPSGRFETNVRLCLSMSDYHPESWTPAWSLAKVLQGLQSFMCEESPTAGAIHPPPPLEERRRLAGESLAWNKAQADFLKAFPEVDRIVAASRCSQASAGSSPPVQHQEDGRRGDDDRERPAQDSGDAPAVRPADAAAAVVAAPEPGAAPSSPTAGAAEALPAATAFSPGDVVRIRGLKARPELNGQSCVVEPPEPHIAEAGRVQVRVGGEVMALRPVSLEPITGASA